VSARLGSDQPLGLGPVFAWRPWRLAAGLMLGMAAATKWSGAYALAVFGIMTVVWEIGARRAAGLERPVRGGVLRDGPVAFVTMVGTAVVTYLVSWSGWIASDNGWGRRWAESNPASALGSLVPDWLRSLWHYHDQMLEFHTNLTKDHDYASQAWSWLILRRPVSFDYQGLDQGESGCDAARCSQEVLALGTPLLWWAACVALLVCLWRWFLHRDWRPGATLAGVLATWVPWLAFPDRTTFAFYAVAVAPFLVLAVAYVLGLIIGPPTATANRRATGAIIAGAFVVAVVVVAAWFYPIHVDQVIPYDEWRQRMWFTSWI
jgi:dolichyl-phosphate-mannose--protein O-mannosyl transferase